MNYTDAVDLAAYACGFEEDKVENAFDHPEELDDALFEKFGVDLDQFTAIAEELLKLTPIIKTVIDGDMIHAFVKGNLIIAKGRVGD